MRTIVKDIIVLSAQAGFRLAAPQDQQQDVSAAVPTKGPPGIKALPAMISHRRARSILRHFVTGQNAPTGYITGVTGRSYELGETTQEAIQLTKGFSMGWFDLLCFARGTPSLVKNPPHPDADQNIQHLVRGTD